MTKVAPLSTTYSRYVLSLPIPNPHNRNFNHINFLKSPFSKKKTNQSASLPCSSSVSFGSRSHSHHLPLRICSLSSPSRRDMGSNCGPNLYPLHRCKTLHLVRHAQGTHNVAGEKDHANYSSEEYFDADLTPLGWQQVDNLRKHVHTSGLSKKVELVITSPLSRTIQTAIGVFGGDAYSDGINVRPLMVANGGNSGRTAVSSLGCPRFLAVEICREHLGVHPCDRRRSVTEYQTIFPAVDFSLVQTNEDTWWKADVREKNEEIAVRGKKFFNWLWTRKEKEIAVVTHSGFLFHTLNAFGNDCQIVKSEMCKNFANCELRSIVIVDTRLSGSDSSTYYPGKIPPGLDLPSDTVDENHNASN